MGTGAVRRAEVVLPCKQLDETTAFFCERLGFRLDAIFPADAPRVCLLSGFGLRLRLELGSDAPAGALRVVRDGSPASRELLVAPNGTRVELVTESADLELPEHEPAHVVTNASQAWSAGRAGMLYRDLIPGRQGGRCIASHIRIAQAGPVADYVHYHRVRFQLIYCTQGWVRVVYEDQGEPFELHAGDCVLQPPGIRHRVLECSAGLEVVELSSPAEHETCVEHELELPTATRAAERTFGGQRFVRHVAADATWLPRGPEHAGPGFEARDTGIAAATDGLVEVRVVRNAGARAALELQHSHELLFRFLTAGRVELAAGGKLRTLSAGSAFLIPRDTPFALRAPSPDLEYLEVLVPSRGSD